MMSELAPILTAFLVLAGSSLLMYGLATFKLTSGWFKPLDDMVKRVVHLGIALGLSYVATRLGGIVGADLLGEFQGLTMSLLSVASGGMIYRMGRAQPGNPA